jgi:hypothetical protein
VKGVLSGTLSLQEESEDFKKVVFFLRPFIFSIVADLEKVVLGVSKLADLIAKQYSLTLKIKSTALD